MYYVQKSGEHDLSNTADGARVDDHKPNNSHSINDQSHVRVVGEGITTRTFNPLVFYHFNGADMIIIA